MLNKYRQLWAPDGSKPPSLLLSIALFGLSVLLPMLLVFLFTDPEKGILGLGLIGGVIFLTIFFNVKVYAVYVLPLIFLFTPERFIIFLTILFLVSFLAGRLRAGKISIEFPFPVLLFIVAVTGLIGYAKAYDLSVGRYVYMNMLILPMLIFIVFYNLKLSNEATRKMLTIMCIFAAITGYLSLGRYFVVGWTRWIVGWSGANPAAVYFSMITPFALLSFINSKSHTSKVQWWIILLGIFAGIFITQSRAAYLVILISLVYISWKDRRVLKVMTPIIIIGVVAVPTLVLYRLAMLFGVGLFPDWSSIGRVEIWMNSFKLIPHFFPFGMGIDNYEMIYNLTFPKSIIRAMHPHNVYLRWYFEFSFFTTIGLLLIFFLTFKKSFRSIKRMKKDEWTEDDWLLMSINAGFLNALIAAMVDSPFHHLQVAIALWVFIAFQLTILKRKYG